MKKNKTTVAISLSVVVGFLLSATTVTALTILMGVMSVGHEGAFVFGVPGLEFGTVLSEVAVDGSSSVSMIMGPAFLLTLLTPPILLGLLAYSWQRRRTARSVEVV